MPGKGKLSSFSPTAYGARYDPMEQVALRLCFVVYGLCGVWCVVCCGVYDVLHGALWCNQHNTCNMQETAWARQHKAHGMNAHPTSHKKGS